MPEQALFEGGFEKVIAASSGAMVTSLTMNPFDVIKTRLQTQSSPEPMFVPSSKLPPPLASGFRTDASTSKLNAATCCQSTYFTTNKNSDSLLCKFDPRLTPAAALPSSRAKAKGKAPAVRSYYTSAARSAAISTECSFPTPIAAASDLTARSAEAASRQYKGFFDALTKIVRNEGVGTLWRGVGPSLAISVPSQATYMVGYDYLRRVMLAHPLPFLVSAKGQASEIHKVGAPLIAGSLVRACLVTFFSPIELIRTRLQSLPASSSAATVTRSTLDLVKLQGVGTLWRGLPATLWRDVPFSGIYWASYEILQRMMTGSGFGEGGHGRKSRDTFATAFIGGAVSGSIAATCTNPFDVIKTRRQASGAASSKTTGALLMEIGKQEGLPGLMRGLTPRLAKVAPACGLMISFYEIGLRWTQEAVQSVEVQD